MPSSGPNSSGTIANDSTVGSVAWTNLSLASTSNNQYAQCAVGSSGVVTNYLKATNFGFSIPGGSTIDGIRVGVECSSDQLFASDYSVKIVKGGVISGNNKAYTPDITSESIILYGGVADLWGLAFTDSDINSSTFGVVWSGQNNSTKFSSTYYIDHITITVYYTSGGGSSVSQKIIMARQAINRASNY